MTLCATPNAPEWRALPIGANCTSLVHFFQMVDKPLKFNDLRVIGMAHILLPFGSGRDLAQLLKEACYLFLAIMH